MKREKCVCHYLDTYFDAAMCDAWFCPPNRNIRNHSCGNISKHPKDSLKNWVIFEILSIENL